VAGVVVTELSDENLREFFGPDSGLAVKQGTVELPRAVMNRSTHHKVLAALEAGADHVGEPGKFKDSPAASFTSPIRSGRTSCASTAIGRVPSWQIRHCVVRHKGSP
jgi:hypothetical protein